MDSSDKKKSTFLRNLSEWVSMVSIIGL